MLSFRTTLPLVLLGGPLGTTLQRSNDSLLSPPRPFPETSHAARRRKIPQCIPSHLLYVKHTHTHNIKKSKKVGCRYWKFLSQATNITKDSVTFHFSVVQHLAVHPPPDNPVLFPCRKQRQNIYLSKIKKHIDTLEKYNGVKNASTYPPLFHPVPSLVPSSPKHWPT